MIYVYWGKEALFHTFLYFAGRGVNLWSRYGCNNNDESITGSDMEDASMCNTPHSRVMIIVILLRKPTSIQSVDYVFLRMVKGVCHDKATCE